jgi:hypothetical protein
MKEHRLLYSKVVKNFTELLKLISEPTSDKLPTAFRGQADSDWLIQSSFSRWYIKNNPESEEAILIEDIKAIEEKAKLGFNERVHYHELADDIIDNLAIRLERVDNLDLTYSQIMYLAQHYDLPTNLIDFTFDPNIALFFAFDYKTPPKSGYVSWFKTTPWFYAQSTISAVCQHHFVDKNELWKEATTLIKGDCGIKVPAINKIDLSINLRINAQKGCFVYYSEVFPYDKVMHMMECWQPNGGWGSQLKIDIPISLKGEVMDYLSSLPSPITKKSMYPQIDEKLMPSGSVSLDSHIKTCVKETRIKT